MPSDLDRLRGWPRINSFHQSNSFVPLFLPYQPLRDNLVLDVLCGEPGDTAERVECLRQLWTVSIDGTNVPMENFNQAERADLGMRGLIGLVPLIGLEPGLHQIEVAWYPGSAEGAATLDDRYTQRDVRYVIPIAFAPSYEMQLD